MGLAAGVAPPTVSGPVYDSAARVPPFRQALADLWRYRGLVRLLVARELTVRYKRSLLGVAWTVLNPVLISLVMWFVFNAVFRPAIPGGVPYIVYLLSGIVAVTYFQQGVAMTGASVAVSAGILTKVYAPPVVFAFATACAGAVTFGFGLVPLFALQLVIGPGIPWTVVLVPVPLVFLLALVAGLGLIVATLALQYSDVIDLTNVLLLLLAYLTPTFYPESIVPDKYMPLLEANPMYWFVKAFRDLEYGGDLPSLLTCSVVVGTGVLAISAGIAIFVQRWRRLASTL
jgi:ABC-type polysaccharide/polyol phosphate export permease